ncbi:MAG: hypothetical protein M3N08_00180 [Pseudomonadota bacterium]|nr:hypothetical protein [Pseudomonadota bacterium]
MMISLGDQILTFAALLEAIVLLPVLLEFLMERRKRQYAIELSLEIVDVASLHVHLAGLDELMHDIRDLIDRARHPEAYAELRLGNEIMIAGPPLSGKKSLAELIAREAAFDRIIIVHNPRNAEALARAKHLALRSRNKKTMLLLPRLDLLNDRQDEDLLAEIDALIEAVSELSHALVVGTTNHLISGSEIDNLFGIVLTLPGAPVVPVPMAPRLAEVHQMLADVASYYLKGVLRAGYTLADMTPDGFVARLLMSVTNPAHIADVVVLCQTAAIYRQRTGHTKTREISTEMLEASIRRVIVTDEGGSG